MRHWPTPNRPGGLPSRKNGGPHAYRKDTERKSIADLVSCCAASNRARFENELHRLRGYRFKRLLIVGKRSAIEAGRYRSKITPAAVLGTLSAFEIRYEIPVVFEPTPEQAARTVERWAWYAAREAVEAVNSMARAALG